MRIAGNDPRLPAPLRALGIRQTALAKLCMNTEGVVVAVTVLSTSDPLITQPLAETLGGWRYHPYLIDGHPVPFCTTAHFTFETR